MSDNPFEPPKSGYEQPPRDREPGSIWKAVLFGVATDILGTWLVSVVISIVYGIILAGMGMTQEDISRSFENADMTSPVQLVAMGAGLLMSGVGGYVCARVANVTSFTPLGIQSLIIVAYGALSSGGQGSWLLLLGLNLTSLVAIFVGGWLVIRKLRRL